MITSLAYSNGYSDALFDLYGWFSCPPYKRFLSGIGIKQLAITKLLKFFIDHKDNLMKEKEDFQILVKIGKDRRKKETIEIKPYNGELIEKQKSLTQEEYYKNLKEDYFEKTGICL